MTSFLKAPEWPYYKWETAKEADMEIGSGQDTKAASKESKDENNLQSKPRPAETLDKTATNAIDTLAGKTLTECDEQGAWDSQNLFAGTMDGQITTKCIPGMKSEVFIQEDDVTLAGDDTTPVDSTSVASKSSEDVREGEHELECDDKVAPHGQAMSRNSELKIGFNIAPHFERINHELLETSSLEKLFYNFSSLSNVFADDIQNTIREEINSIMQQSIDKVARTNKLFECCRLIPAGSVAEGTKVGKADEFDFLILLDSLSKKDKWKLCLDKSFLRIVSKDVKVCAALLSDNPELLLFDENLKQTYLTPDIRHVLIDNFVTTFDDCLSLTTEWKRIKSDNSECCTSDIAATLHLVSEVYDMNVDVDVCMCVSVGVEEIESTLNQTDKEDTLVLFSYLKGLFETAPFEIFVIIGKNMGIWDVISTRITAPLLELGRFQFYGPSSTRLLTYRLAKCIVANFLPKLTKIFGCKRCCHPLVRSYHLKNIILSMMKNYSDDREWDQGMITLRVLEMFVILSHCIKNKSDEVANLAVCCVPGTLRLDEVMTFNPFIPDSRMRSRDHQLFFTEDSHKPRFQLSFSPEYGEIVNTNCEAADTVIRAWFHKLNNEHWSSHELLPALSDLLIDISAI